MALVLRLKGKSFTCQRIQMKRKIMLGRSYLTGVDARLLGWFNPPASPFLFYQVALSILNSANFQAVFVRNANRCHWGNFPYRRPQSRRILPRLHP